MGDVTDLVDFAPCGLSFSLPGQNSEPGKDENIIPHGPPVYNAPQRNTFLLSRALGSSFSSKFHRAARIAHWAVCVGDYVHELVNVGGRCHYHTRVFKREEWQRSERKGITRYNDNALRVAGMDAIEVDRVYNLNTNNCQNFVCRLLTAATGRLVCLGNEVDSIFPFQRAPDDQWPDSANEVHSIFKFPFLIQRLGEPGNQDSAGDRIAL